jgi:predicted dehydrogenase
MRYVILGCGSIGTRHLRNLLQLGERDVVVFDVRAERRQAVEALGVRAVASLDEALAERPDAALICTPNSHHAPHALQALRAGAHLFIEKPLADALEPVDELLAEAHTAQRAILVGCNFRFDPALRRLKTLLDDRVIGRPLGARIIFGQHLPDWHPWEDYRQGYSARQDLGGGVLLDAVHELDYTRWLLGEVDAVSCLTGRAGDLEIDVEDSAALLLRFAAVHGRAGIVAEVHLDYLQRAGQRGAEVYGTEGTLNWTFRERRLRTYTAATTQWEEWTWQPRTDEFANEMYLTEMAHFRDCCLGLATPEQDGWQARRILEIVIAAKRSSAEGRVVPLPEPARPSAVPCSGVSSSAVPSVAASSAPRA